MRGEGSRPGAALVAAATLSHMLNTVLEAERPLGLDKHQRHHRQHQHQHRQCRASQTPVCLGPEESVLPAIDKA